jgi:hypothetical protein
MKRLSKLMAGLAVVGLAVSPVFTYAATTKAPVKTSAKAKPAPKPSPETIKWGKTQCEKADKMLAKGDYEKARDVYSQVLWKLPLSPRAKDGLKKCEAAIRAKQNRDRENAFKAAKTGAADAKSRMDTDQKLKANATGVLEGDQSTIAQRLVGLCAKGDFATVASAFDSSLRSSMTSDAIRNAWNAVVAQNGPFQSVSTIRTSNEAGYDCVYVTTQFEQAAFDAKVVFNQAKQVAGFFILPKQ